MKKGTKKRISKIVKQSIYMKKKKKIKSFSINMSEKVNNQKVTKEERKIDKFFSPKQNKQFQ